MTEWQPIETAPRDGRRVLATLANGIPIIVRWSATIGAWCGTGDHMSYDVTHWMPLPAPPKENSDE